MLISLGSRHKGRQRVFRVASGMKNSMAMLAISSGVVLGLVTTGCRTSKPDAGAGRKTVEMPEHAKPAPELAGLSFLVGSWVSANPNKTVNEEV